MEGARADFVRSFPYPNPSDGPWIKENLELERGDCISPFLESLSYNPLPATVKKGFYMKVDSLPGNLGLIG